MTHEIQLSSKMAVELIDYMGTDLSIVNAARVSLNQHSDEMTERDAGLVNFLMKNKHASPFEHCTMSLRVSAPIVVVREWHRHRTQSYNEWSGRYSELEPRFYVPGEERPLIQTGKPGAYKFEIPEDTSLLSKIDDEFKHVCQTAWDSYQYLMVQGVAKEVARMILPLNIYTSWYATANLRNWVNFLALRAEEQAMWEIRQLAYAVEEILTEHFPVAMETWNKNNRGAI